MSKFSGINRPYKAGEIEKTPQEKLMSEEWKPNIETINLEGFEVNFESIFEEIFFFFFSMSIEILLDET